MTIKLKNYQHNQNIMIILLLVEVYPVIIQQVLGFDFPAIYLTKWLNKKT